MVSPFWSRFRWVFWLLYWAVLAPAVCLLPGWLAFVCFHVGLDADRERGERLHRSADEEAVIWFAFAFMASLWALYCVGLFLIRHRRRKDVAQPHPLSVVECVGGGCALLIVWVALFLAIGVFRIV